MIIKRGGLKLVGLREEHLELVRQKRNLPEIRNAMEYRAEITPQMQRDWFASISDGKNYYYLIEIDNVFAGLISAANIDWENGVVNNGGIFIWDSVYLHSPEVLQASLLLTDFGYYIGLSKNYIRILSDNSRSIAFNKALGYELLPGQESVYNQMYELPSAERYFSATKKMRGVASIGEKIHVLLDTSEYEELKTKIRFDGNEYIGNIVFEVI